MAMFRISFPVRKFPKPFFMYRMMRAIPFLARWKVVRKRKSHLLVGDYSGSVGRFFGTPEKCGRFSCAGVFWSLLGYFAFRSDSAKGAKVCSDPIPSPRCNADSCLTHFPKTGCKAREPCGRISANMFAAEPLLRSTIGNVLAGGPTLRSTIGNVLAGGPTLRLDIGNMFVVKPTLRSNNDNVLSAWLPLRLIMETCLRQDQRCGWIMTTKLRQTLRFALVAISKSSINARFTCFLITCFNTYGRSG